MARSVYAIISLSLSLFLYDYASVIELIPTGNICMFRV